MASKVVSDEGYGDIPRNVYTEAWCMGDRVDRGGHTEDSSAQGGITVCLAKVGSHRDKLTQPARNSLCITGCPYRCACPCLGRYTIAGKT